jgi:aryl-alcohol dehydrogenase-like predicted oxidoreductase
MRITGQGVWASLEPRHRTRCAAPGGRARITLIDTADSYGPEVSERLIAAALHPYPPHVVIATKAGLTRPGPNKWTPNGRPAHLRTACEGSLRRLKVERIDLFQLHRIDPAVAMEDQIGTLTRLQEEGKIRHVGLSEVSVEEIERARELVPIVSVQNRYNPVERRYEDVVDYCERNSIGFLPWFPLAEGRSAAAAAARGQRLRRLLRRRRRLAAAALAGDAPDSGNRERGPPG